jgi:GT2 family glycosyltransferase
MTQRPPRVSVVVTCFNLGIYLAEAIDSVETQTFQDFEIVIVDDGSTDPETVRLLETWVRPRTQVLRTANRGLPAARNFGVAHSRGELLCCLDADDKLAPTWLEKAVEALDADPDLAFVSHWLRYFGEEEGDWCPESAGFPQLLDANTINGAALVRRSVWSALGGCDESMREGCEDWELWIRAIEGGYRGAILPEVLFYYRRRKDSMSRAMAGERQVAISRRMIEKHRATYAPHLHSERLREYCVGAAAIHDVEWVLESWLEPELRQRREEAAMLRRRLERALALRALRDSRDRWEREARALETSRGEWRQRAEAVEADRERVRQHVAELQSSWSWRLTAPLRRAVRLLRPSAER